MINANVGVDIDKKKIIVDVKMDTIRQQKVLLDYLIALLVIINV